MHFSKKIIFGLQIYPFACLRAALLSNAPDLSFFKRGVLLPGAPDRAFLS